LLRTLRIVLLQSDLRLQDNPALYTAAAHSDPLLVIFVPFHRKGSARDAYFYESAATLQTALRHKGIASIFSPFGQLESYLQSLKNDFKICALYINKLDQLLPQEWEPLIIKEKENLLFPCIPKPFKIFTPFWKHCLSTCPSFSVLPVPHFRADHQLSQLPSHVQERSFPCSSHPWWAKIKSHREIGEAAAQARWEHFKENLLPHYDEKRDFMDHNGTSDLSAALAVGEISIRHLWNETLALYKTQNPQLATSKFLNELGWREFAAHLLSHSPDMSERALNPKYQNFPWKENPAWLEKWTSGETGYPLIDAAMKQLWETGTMHNRSRMLVASFLTKNLLIPWQTGEKWFFDTLIDADLASNAMNWQWVAGCGTDAAPYFRIFNPMLQAEKFDPQGIYRKKWLPCLSHLSPKDLQEPWGKVPLYPLPIIDLNVSRRKALALFQEWSGSGSITSL
jgi:deoxyribodipyrimidine photo-lyase